MGKIVGAYIEITGLCNERCPYCYNEKNVDLGQSLPYDLIADLIFQLKSEHNLNNIAFSGGEPFLHPEISKLLYFCKKEQMSVTVISNGTCFDKSNMPLLCEFNPNLQISFDGYSNATHDITRGIGNFDKITNGIRKARLDGYRGRITVRINLHKDNIDFFQNILTMLEYEFETTNGNINMCDINAISLAILHPTDDYHGSFTNFIKPNSIYENSAFFSIIEEWNNIHSTRIEHDFDIIDIGCPYNADNDEIKCGLRISTDGKVFPCQLFMAEAFCIGNIFNDNLNKILNGDMLSRFIDAIHNRRQNISECKRCGFAFACAAGCPAMAFIENGTLNSLSSVCSSRKDYFRTTVVKIIDNIKESNNEQQ